MKKNTLFLMTLCLIAAIETFAQSSNTLWFKQPARYFEECFVLGNGKMGASVFGGAMSEKIFLNDVTFWSGEPVNANMNPEAYKLLPAVREALKNENYKEADKLNQKLQGKYSESYVPVGTMFIDFQYTDTTRNYYRELNIGNAISKVSYEVNGVKFTREYFVSHPDKIMVIKLSSSQKGMLNFGIKYESAIKYQLSMVNNILKAKGYAPIHTEPDYLGDVPNPVVFAENKGTRITTLVKIESADGIITATDSTLNLSEGTEALVFVSVATSFNGFDKNPATEGLNDEAIASKQLKKALSKSFIKLKTGHVEDFQKYSGRVTLNLGKTSAPDLPTDERLKRYAEGKEDKNLEILYFQFGRYLLISSSRTPGVPANLQGIWNPYIRPPWSSNYTVNINVEENYWPAEIANLSEMHLPMMGFIKNVSKTGAITAKTFYGVNGWTACHNSDIWAMSNPVGGHPMWANWNMGGVWLSTHLWEHYVFTQDKKFLKNEAYPLLRGSAQFCLEWMIEDKDGNLITSPSTSPENLYLTPDGFQGATMYGGTADLAMIRELLTQTVKASRILNTDAAFRTKLENALARLRPYQIGKKANLQEWYFDWEDADPQHRHQSHLFGLFPGHQITPSQTPELANACRKTLEIKGDETTGWSKGWRINLWARLRDGNRAYKMYRELLRYVEPGGLDTNYSKGGGTYPNLLDAHPPFQIDGNFGGTAAVIEMLMQSTESEICLLPSLPNEWSEGSVSGICARGAYEIDMEWKDNALINLTILSKTNSKTTFKSGNKQKEISLKKGQKSEMIW